MLLHCARDLTPNLENLGNGLSVKRLVQFRARTILHSSPMTLVSDHCTSPAGGNVSISIKEGDTSNIDTDMGHMPAALPPGGSLSTLDGSFTTTVRGKLGLQEDQSEAMKSVATNKNFR